MASEDIYTMAAITALIVFSYGVTWMLRRSKPLTGMEDDDHVSGRQLHGERRNEASAKRFEVNFSESGIKHTWDPAAESLLAFAEARGIPIDFQCRAGECGTCRTRLIEGRVAYRPRPSMHPGEGYCLLCVGVPASDLVLAL